MTIESYFWINDEHPSWRKPSVHGKKGHIYWPDVSRRRLKEPISFSRPFSRLSIWQWIMHRKEMDVDTIVATCVLQELTLSEEMKSRDGKLRPYFHFLCIVISFFPLAYSQKYWNPPFSLHWSVCSLNAFIPVCNYHCFKKTILILIRLCSFVITFLLSLLGWIKMAIIGVWIPFLKWLKDPLRFIYNMKET